MALANRQDFVKQIARGYSTRSGFALSTANAGSSTSASAGSGGLNFAFHSDKNSAFPTQGTIIHNTLTGQHLVHSVFGGIVSGTTSQACFLAYAYKVGTINLAATGDQFTHSTGTFPLLRTMFGVASQPINCWPMIQVTVATTTTAPVIKLSNVAGTQGYTNHAGSTVIGSKTFTFPAAATVLGSMFHLRIEDTDFSVQDIQGLQTVTAAAAGTASVYLIEPLLCLSNPGTIQFGQTADSLFGRLSLPDMQPATPTSGTVESNLGVLVISAANFSGLTKQITALGVYPP